MNDAAALLERHVANAASAWRHAKADTEAYRRLVVASAEWDEYVAPRLDEPDDVEVGDVAARLRWAARRALHAMDEEATRLARQVALTASAWLHTEADTEAYRRFVGTVDDWDAYAAPQLEAPSEELLDQLADDSAPLALSEVLADFTARFSKAARKDA